MKVTSDPWVINTIQGYKIEFWAQPKQLSPPTPLYLSEKETQLMNTEISKLLEKGAISAVSSLQTQGFLSRIFLVPKKDGSQRPVINLRQLNYFVIWEHFKMESIHLVENLIQEGDWMIKMDLKDAYFSIPNIVSGFASNGRSRYTNFSVCPSACLQHHGCSPR